MCKIDFEAHWAGDKLSHLILTLLFWILKFAQVKPWILCASNNDNELPIFLPPTPKCSHSDAGITNVLSQPSPHYLLELSLFKDGVCFLFP